MGGGARRRRCARRTPRRRTPRDTIQSGFNGRQSVERHDDVDADDGIGPRAAHAAGPLPESDIHTGRLETVNLFFARWWTDTCAVPPGGGHDAHGHGPRLKDGALCSVTVRHEVERREREPY